jgi:hypothetical protein
VSVFPTPTPFFLVSEKSDTDTDTKVLRCRRYFLILNPTLFAFFSFKTQKKAVLVSVWEKPKPSPSDTDATIFGVRKTDTDTNLVRCRYFDTETDTAISGVRKTDTETNLFWCRYFDTNTDTDTGYFGVTVKSNLRRTKSLPSGGWLLITIEEASSLELGLVS